MRRWVCFASATLLLPGCETVTPKPNHLLGSWGGPHVGIVFQGGLADVQFDCAAGTIDDALPLEGKFAVQGTYRTATRGQQNIGQFFRSEKARYSGDVAKGLMNLSVALEDGTILGPFTLNEGAAPVLTRCR